MTNKYCYCTIFGIERPVPLVGRVLLVMLFVPYVWLCYLLFCNVVCL